MMAVARRARRFVPGKTDRRPPDAPERPAAADDQAARPDRSRRDGASRPTAPGRAWQSQRAVGVALLAFGLPMWFAGARYTVDGWILVLNWFLAWLLLPFQIPVGAAQVWYGYLLAILLIGWVYSRIETAHFPVHRVEADVYAAYAERGYAMPPILVRYGTTVICSLGAGAILAYVLVAGSDLWTTAIGMLNPAPDAWPISRWLAATPPAVGLWVLWLTFVPEWMLIVGIRKLVR